VDSEQEVQIQGKCSPHFIRPYTVPPELLTIQILKVGRYVPHYYSFTVLFK